METKNRIPVMTLLLILINVVVYLYVEIHGSSYDAEYMIKMGAVYEPYIVQRHEYYRLITHFFLHFGFDHLFNNMISLLILGYSLEKVTGKIRFFNFILFVRNIGGNCFLSVQSVNGAGKCILWCIGCHIWFDGCAACDVSCGEPGKVVFGSTPIYFVSCH